MEGETVFHLKTKNDWSKVENRQGNSGWVPAAYISKKSEAAAAAASKLDYCDEACAICGSAISELPALKNAQGKVALLLPANNSHLVIYSRPFPFCLSRRPSMRRVTSVMLAMSN